VSLCSHTTTSCELCAYVRPSLNSCLQVLLQYVLQCVAVCCSVLRCVAVCGHTLHPSCIHGVLPYTIPVMQSVASFQCVVEYCTIIGVRCSVLKCVAVCCSAPTHQSRPTSTDSTRTTDAQGPCNTLQQMHGPYNTLQQMCIAVPQCQGALQHTTTDAKGSCLLSSDSTCTLLWGGDD